MSHKYNISLVTGDGIGPEISESAFSILQTINDNMGIKFEIKKLEAGDTVLKNTGEALPAEVFETIKNSDACLKAPVGESAKDVIVYLRRMLDLYANIRPAKSYPNMPSLRDDVDLVIVRENTEDLYTGEEFEIGDIAVAMRIISEKASKRIANHAFTIASQREMKKVTCVHKSNVMKKTDGLFARTCSKVANDFPDIKFEDIKEKIEEFLIKKRCKQLFIAWLTDWKNSSEIVINEDIFKKGYNQNRRNDNERIILEGDMLG